MKSFEKFIANVKINSKTNNRMMTLTQSDAEDLVKDLATLLNRENELLREIVEINKNNIIDVKLGGGTF